MNLYADFNNSVFKTLNAVIAFKNPIYSVVIANMQAIPNQSCFQEDFKNAVIFVSQLKSEMRHNYHGSFQVLASAP